MWAFWRYYLACWLESVVATRFLSSCQEPMWSVHWFHRLLQRNGGPQHWFFLKKVFVVPQVQITRGNILQYYGNLFLDAGLPYFVSKKIKFPSELMGKLNNRLHTLVKHWPTTQTCYWLECGLVIRLDLNYLQARSAALTSTLSQKW